MLGKHGPRGGGDEMLFLISLIMIGFMVVLLLLVLFGEGGACRQ